MPAVIIDDEPETCELLTSLVKKYCPDVKLLGCYQSGTEALEAITQLQPSLVFLDIKMPERDSFEMLEQLPQINFDIIFMSRFDNFALKAFQYNAVDYLLKPVDVEQLERAVQKVRVRIEDRIHDQIELLLHKVNHLYNHSQIALPTFEGLQMVNIDNIISCASNSNYTKVYLKKGQKLVVSKTLGDIEDMLRDYAFIRVHHSFLVNINEIHKYVKTDGGYLVMSDGTNIDVSRHKRELLIKKLTHHK